MDGEQRKGTWEKIEEIWMTSVVDEKCPAKEKQKLTLNKMVIKRKITKKIVRQIYGDSSKYGIHILEE